jgi:hypothetical protein
MKIRMNLIPTKCIALAGATLLTVAAARAGLTVMPATAGLLLSFAWPARRR